MSCCYICERTDQELRPYGEDGQPVCFDCAMSTTEHKAEAERQLAKRLDAIEDAGAIALIGDERGARPLPEGEA